MTKVGFQGKLEELNMFAQSPYNSILIDQWVAITCKQARAVLKKGRKFI